MVEEYLDFQHRFTFDAAAEVMEYYRKHPTIAAYDLLLLEDGLPWHQRLALKIAWKCPNTIMVWSRGAGKTWFDAMYAILRAMLYPNEKIGIFGPSFRQSKFVWAEIEKLYKHSVIVQECCIKRPMMPPDKCYLSFKNGSVIEALPLGDGSTIRGARYFDLIVDEATQIPEEIFDVVIRGMTATSKDPMAEVQRLKKQRELLRKGLITEEDMDTSPANKILMTTTGFYRFNHLWRTLLMFEEEIKSEVNQHLHPEIKVDNGTNGTKIMWNDERAILMFTYQDPPSGFMNLASIREAKLKMSEYKFKMEYEAFFPPDSEGFFRRSKLEHARNHDIFTVEEEGLPGFNYVLGIDVARNSDNFAICVGKIVDNALHIVNVITLNNKSFSEMHDTIRRTMRAYNVIHICMDAGGGGTTLQDMLMDERLLGPGERLIWDSINNEEFRDKEGLHVLDMVKFSDDSIPQMAYQMASDLDHGRLLLPCLPSRKYKIVDSMPEKSKGALSTALKLDEEAYQEIEALIDETTNIVASSTRTGRVHLGLPSEISRGDVPKDMADNKKAPRKDRWTACMLACWAWHRCTSLERMEEDIEPAYGFVLR